MKALCVYCGSNPGVRSDYADAAANLARILAARNIGLVYGGASKGLMGILADTVLEAGGEVQGVIPRSLLAKEIGHAHLTKLHIVDTMHERKALMAKLSDGFIALPGGFGTLDELVEALTWAQLGFHAKPCGLLNIAGYFSHLLRYFEQAEAEGFLRPQHRRMLLVAEDPAKLLAQFECYRPPRVEKWVT
jgi:uncharacterized protein (TIGR00730 family)